jgi:hypothetical protein
MIKNALVFFMIALLTLPMLWGLWRVRRVLRQPRSGRSK